MIDFHSHILPGIDDGSRDVNMSLQMLDELRRQGVDTVCATPHFYATQRSVQRFLFRRQEAYAKLLPLLPESSPNILLGAEVLYYPGISHLAELSQLCLTQTDLLLLEMPFSSWSEYYIREVNELAVSGGFTLLLAHIERYYYKQPAAVWDSFQEHGILMQANADFFLSFRTKRKALKLLSQGRIDLLGTDAHNMAARAPRISEARNLICNRLGRGVLREIDQLGSQILQEDVL